MTDFADVRKKASLPTRTVSLCLAGELLDQLEQLEQEFADAPAKPANLGEVSPRRVIAEKIAALQDEMRESTVDFHLRALPARVWALFWGQLPTRKDDETDEAWDGRIFPFYADLVSRTCVDPVMTVDEVGELCDVLHGMAWVRLLNECQKLNAGEVDIPNSAAASELTEISEQT
jgi:hypothetical protein